MKPEILMIRLSENCNAGCFMCDFAHKRDAKFISKEEIDEIKEKIAKSNFKLIRYTGGETLLHKDIEYLINTFHKDGYKTSIITNGYLLPWKYKQLIDAGIDQFVISLDGSTPEIHDKLRDLRGLNKNIRTAIPLIKKLKPSVLIRVNTVVSPYNMNDLLNILDLLIELKVDQWSIIPLKGRGFLWETFDKTIMDNVYKEFLKRTSKLKLPKLLGYSRKWAGRNISEVRNFSKTNKPYTPRGKCQLVEHVRYYVPSSKRLSPCNCASYRPAQLGIKQDETTEGFNLKNANVIAKWLKENGPDTCIGCEPINAYLGEHPGILKKDIFAW